MARAAGNDKAASLAREIADYLVSIQNNDGSWLDAAEPLDHYDQTAEIALWLTEIHSSLKSEKAKA